jgi:hypothetical protein
VAAFEWDGSDGVGSDLLPGAAIAAADTVVRRVEPSYMVLGVVMDSDGADNEIIQPGDNLDLATAVIRCSTLGKSIPMTFVDGKYSTVDGAPILDNVVVVGGESIIQVEGLLCTPGSFECVECLNRYFVAPGATNVGGPGGRCGDAKIFMESCAPVEGYVVALCHDPAALTLDSILVGAAALAAAADFSAAEVFPNGGTLGVVVDLVAPFTNNTIPLGSANHIATYSYCCKTLPLPGQEAKTPLSFCDDVLGTPLKQNVIVVDGLAVSPSLENGEFTCKTVEVPPPPEGGQMFACGSRKQDAQNLPGPLQGSIGTAVEVCFFVKSPEDNAPGHAQFDHIQGFSMGLSYCCDIMAIEVIDIEGTIVEAVGAEFVSVQADNDPNDGDGCELIIGVLVDALPPFDGATIPPLPVFQRIGCVKFEIKDEARLCGTCCDIKFTDGVNGRGKVPIKNLISVENISRSPQTMDCKLCIVDKERFFRGDCNFSHVGSLSVDIADAAAVVSFLFLPGTFKFNPPCLDACDCNDDGRVDLADAFCILQYLFQFGRFPPPPGPGLRETGRPNPNAVEASPDGIDPTDDKLDCRVGNSCAG